jgi:hypothetical protein
VVKEQFGEDVLKSLKKRWKEAGVAIRVVDWGGEVKGSTKMRVVWWKSTCWIMLDRFLLVKIDLLHFIAMLLPISIVGIVSSIFCWGLVAAPFLSLWYFDGSSDRDRTTPRGLGITKLTILQIPWKILQVMFIQDSIIHGSVRQGRSSSHGHFKGRNDQSQSLFGELISSYEIPMLDVYKIHMFHGSKLYHGGFLSLRSPVVTMIVSTLPSGNSTIAIEHGP